MGFDSNNLFPWNIQTRGRKYYNLFKFTRTALLVNTEMFQFEFEVLLELSYNELFRLYYSNFY